MALTSKRIRAGLYSVKTGQGTFLVENRQSGEAWGNEWLWYITSDTSAMWFDPCYTKAEALEVIDNMTREG